MNAPKFPIEDNEYCAKAESALNRFLALSFDLFCITQENGYFQQINPAWENVLGWTESDLLNISWLELFHP
ncbi:MAG TPA: PAS domain-containing protein, partial [Stenomitos sp.]